MLVIKRYTASWCGPCQMLSPIMAELQNENSNVRFTTVDVDQNAEEAKISNVRGVPTVMFLKDSANPFFKSKYSTAETRAPESSAVAVPAGSTDWAMRANPSTALACAVASPPRE